jgi:hypothetical protein
MIPEADAVIPIPALGGGRSRTVVGREQGLAHLRPILGRAWDETYVNDSRRAEPRLGESRVGSPWRVWTASGRTGRCASSAWPRRTAVSRDFISPTSGPRWRRMVRRGPILRRSRFRSEPPWKRTSCWPSPGFEGAMSSSFLLPGRGPARAGRRSVSASWPASARGSSCLGGDEAGRISAEVVPRRGRAADLTGRTSIPVLAAVLARAGAVVANNTGTLHLADAVGAKVVGLYHGPAWCHETSPVGSGHLVFQTEPSCAPCPDHRQVCGGLDCAGALPVQEVLRAVESRIAGVPETGAAGASRSIGRDERRPGLYDPGGDTGGLLQALSRSLLRFPEAGVLEG